ncbi:class I SAM-dependent methyltransferase [Maritimibacter sp. UBA3975]|uniref:class I SAM-dependent methyltransferase n=1 Tax=Maritimibacter sp. UBA3975 TaxID=1946833 RepID=UPI000C0B085D|nr:class I SAM-dependent methyltransferase [Maritimibacter sp. UBA3975]MAM62161.1 hypothetical protein [Maritimibacter sp.]|tara:strand:- start:12610 stop:13383 length:774 start_codon:yes stop_codon:yes gene_type:complete
MTTQGTPRPNPILDVLLDDLPEVQPPHFAGLSHVLGDCVPDENVGQVAVLDHVAAQVPKSGSFRVLDLGCGFGKSKAFFDDLNADLHWNGVDISERWDVEDETFQKACKTYNGVDIPFEKNTFDMVFSTQVFEHVRLPEPLLKEIRRVLKPGGVFTGSVSCMEPFHMRSIFCFTPYGWKTILEDAGLPLRFLASGVDGVSLSLWHFHRHLDQGRIFRNSNLNAAIDAVVERDGLDWRSGNVMKLMFSGQMVFTAQAK